VIEVPRRAVRFVFLSNGTGRRLGDGQVMWRLMSANNRPIGSSARSFDDIESCRAAAQSLHEAADALQPSVHFDHTTGVWTWRMEHDGTAVAVCVHAYLRRFECLRAVAQFRTGAAEASPQDATVRHLGARVLPVAAGRNGVTK
jgi:hypothetical protein